jgi:nicotinamidase-related amidase
MAFHDISHPAAHETVFPKTTNSAFQGSDLGEYLRAKKCWKIYFAGLSVDLCLGTTVRHASDLDVGKHVDERGENVPGQLMLVGDATAAWAKHGGKYDAETVHGVSVESLKEDFCRVVTTEEVLKELGIHEGEVVEM